MTRTFIATTALATVLLAGAAHAQSTIETEGMTMEDGAVTFTNVHAEQPGYLVVTEDIPEGTTAAEPASIAHAPVEAGDNENVRIEGAFEDGLPYRVYLFVETNDQDGFQWGENVDLDDEISMNDGQPVETTFDMIVESGETDS